MPTFTAPPGPPPTILDPINFAARADAWNKWYYDTHLPELNALLGGVLAGGNATSLLGKTWADMRVGKNAIIGGDFSINPWQRGTSFTAIADATYYADRWKIAKTTAGVFDLFKAADAPSVAQCGRLATHCLHIDCTTLDAAVAAGDLLVLSQQIEGQNFIPFAQKPMTLTFWHKHTKTGTYCVSFSNTARDRSFVAEYAQAVTDTWEKATIPILATPAAGTWDYTTGVGLRVNFSVMAGATYQAAANAWQNGEYYATANQVNGADSAANNFKLALVQLEQGDLATDFESRTISEELQRCMRYFIYFNDAQLANGSYAGQAYSATTSDLSVPFPAEMRAAPTGTVNNVNLLLRKADATNQAVTSVLIVAASTRAAIFRMGTAAGLVAGNATLLNSSGGANSASFSAEL